MKGFDTFASREGRRPNAGRKFAFADRYPVAYNFEAGPALKHAYTAVVVEIGTISHQVDVIFIFYIITGDSYASGSLK